MKIAIIHMPFWPTFSPPLGPAYICSVLKRLGHDVTVFDKNVEWSTKYSSLENNPWSDELLNENSKRSYFNSTTQKLLKNDISNFMKEIISGDYDAIGFSVNELSYFPTQYISKLIKKLFPSLLIFWGGPHVNAKNDYIIQDVNDGVVDICFEAEAEETVQDFFNAYENKQEYHSILGLICKGERNEAIRKKKRPSINYKELPFPDFSDFPFELYKEKQLPVMMSRGCVATCSFCTEFLTWKSYRVRTALDVVEEMKSHIEKYNINNFIFCDSLINGNHEQLQILANGLKSVDCTWTAFCRVDKKLTKQMLTDMYEGGCRELLVGFESDSQKVLNLMNKGTKVEQNQRVLDDAYEVGLKIHGLFLIGFPGETESDFDKTMRFIHKNKSKFYVISIGNSLTLPPQSVVGMLPKKFNILTDDSGEAILDKDGEWTSLDGVVTPLIRKKRMRKLRNYLDCMSLKWVPKKYVEMGVLTRFKQSVQYTLLKHYYSVKLK
jgi:hypothetical protein